MTEKRYAMNASIILGVSAVLMVFIFVFVAHHHDIPDQIRQHRGTLLSSGSSVAETIKPVGQVSVPAEATQREPVKNAVAAPPSSRNVK